MWTQHCKTQTGMVDVKTFVSDPVDCHIGAVCDEQIKFWNKNHRKQNSLVRDFNLPNAQKLSVEGRGSRPSADNQRKCINNLNFVYIAATHQQRSHVDPISGGRFYSLLTARMSVLGLQTASQTLARTIFEAERFELMVHSEWQALFQQDFNKLLILCCSQSSQIWKCNQKILIWNRSLNSF